MPAPLIKPTDKAIDHYQLTLREFRDASVQYESATRHAFQTLLSDTARRRKWQLVPEFPIKLATGRTIIPDGTLRDEFTIHRGYWEAKDTSDDLDVEIRKKTACGYPDSNVLFEDTHRAILLQNRVRTPEFDLRDNRQVADVLNGFYQWSAEAIQDFEAAVDAFKTDVPLIGQSLAAKGSLEITVSGVSGRNFGS